MSSSLGRLFKATVFGESHGKTVGVVVDGCPAGLKIKSSDVQFELNRRRPGFAPHTSRRKEEDKIRFLSGVFKGRATGAPLCMLVPNRDVESSYYEKIKETPRPGHADYAAFLKYKGFSDYRGGGRFSGRMTAALVMAGAVAKKILAPHGVRIAAHITRIGDIVAKPQSQEKIFSVSASNSFACADSAAAKKMLEAIDSIKRQGDSIGGIVECIALNPPQGLGEPFFDTIEGDLAKALFAVPAVKGVEFGAGFRCVSMRGSENNDPFVIKNGKIITATNNCGGVLGGIANGMPIVFRVAVKPTPSISLPQRTVNLKSMKEEIIRIKGRHDPCIVPRVVPVVEAVTAIVLADHFLAEAGAL
jgi:chorismate synthase